MPSFELSHLQGISAPRALSESDRAQRDLRKTQAAQIDAPSLGKPGVAIEVGAALDTSTPPVENDRVKQIREALKDGTYPLVPTKIVDAIIAARVGLGVDAK